MDFPETLRAAPSPPQQLFVSGLPIAEQLKKPRVAIVGSRKVSAYGREVTSHLARELDITIFDQTLTISETTGKIRSLGAGQ